MSQGSLSSANHIIPTKPALDSPSWYFSPLSRTLKAIDRLGGAAERVGGTDLALSAASSWRSCGELYDALACELDEVVAEYKCQHK